MRLMRSASSFALLLLSLSAGSGHFAPAQTSPSTVPQAKAAPRPASTPYSGDLSIFETPGRDERLQIARVMDLLGLKSGSSVADLGAGSGWFTVRASKRVAPNGTVFAEDINPESVTYIRRRATKEGLANVDVIQGTPDDPKLPPTSVDAVLMLKVYHEIADPLALLRNLKPALRPGAKVGVIDRNGDGTDHGLNAPVLIHEMQEAGFRLSSRYDFTKADGQDYFLIFTQRPE